MTRSRDTRRRAVSSATGAPSLRPYRHQSLSRCIFLSHRVFRCFAVELYRTAFFTRTMTIRIQSNKQDNRASHFARGAARCAFPSPLPGRSHLHRTRYSALLVGRKSPKIAPSLGISSPRWKRTEPRPWATCTKNGKNG